jgi:hypothetical protein
MYCSRNKTHGRLSQSYLDQPDFLTTFIFFWSETMKHLKLTLCAAMLCLVGAGNSYAGYAECYVYVGKADVTNPNKHFCSTSTLSIPRNTWASLWIGINGPDPDSRVTATFFNPSNSQMYWQTPTLYAYGGSRYMVSNSATVEVPANSAIARNIAARARLTASYKADAKIKIDF